MEDEVQEQRDLIFTRAGIYYKTVDSDVVTLTPKASSSKWFDKNVF